MHQAIVERELFLPGQGDKHSAYFAQSYPTLLDIASLISCCWYIQALDQPQMRSYNPPFLRTKIQMLLLLYNISFVTSSHYKRTAVLNTEDKITFVPFFREQSTTIRVSLLMARK